MAAFGSGISRRFSLVTRYLPIGLGMLLIVGLTIPQIKMTDRLSRHEC